MILSGPSVLSDADGSGAGSSLILEKREWQSGVLRGFAPGSQTGHSVTLSLCDYPWGARCTHAAQ